MILILEDTLSELNNLKKALLEKGIPETKFIGFQNTEEAKNWFSDQLNKNSPENLPILIIADVTQSDSMIDGRTFVRDSISALKRRGYGAWTYIISANPSSLEGVVENENVNFTQSKLVDNWAGNIADTAASILSPKFESVEENDPLTPPLESLLPKDRIYLYSSAEADMFGLEQDGLPEYLQSFLPIRTEKSSPLLMHRGTFSEINFRHNSVLLTRCLLRWRYIWLKIHREINAGQNYQGRVKVNLKSIFSWTSNDGWSSNVEELFLDRETGVPPSIENIIIEFKNNDLYKNIIKNLFKGQDIPPMPKTGIGQHEKFKSEKFATLFLKEIPEIPIYRNSKLLDGFMTRLHFVLTNEEVRNFLDWKQGIYSLAPEVSANFGIFFRN